MNIRRNIAEFARERFWERVFCPNPPTRIAVKRSFVDYLSKAIERPELICEELAERNLNLLLAEVDAASGTWEALGLPKPISLTKGGVAITWAHEKFEAIAGFAPPPKSFAELHRWISGASGSELLFFGAAMLYCMGCTKIFVTDTTGDGGVDLLGSSDHVCSRGVVWIVQAKSCQGRLSREVLLAEFAKFTILPQHPKWPDYSRALGVESCCDGISRAFVFVSNAEFGSELMATSSKLPAILRSGRQLAFFLSQRAALARWRRAFEELGEPVADLETNLTNVFQRVI